MPVYVSVFAKGLSGTAMAEETWAWFAEKPICQRYWMHLWERKPNTVWVEMGTLHKSDTLYKQECWEFQAVFGMSSVPWSIETLLFVSLDQSSLLSIFSHTFHMIVQHCSKNDFIGG